MSDYLEHHGVQGQKNVEYGIPEQKKFPLDTKDHVISAIRFFNYAKPRFRKELAKRIAKKVKEYNIQLTPSKNNDFYNYYQPDGEMIHCAIVGNKFLEEYLSSDDVLSHHGIVGQKWGHRNGPPYPLGAESHSKAQIAAAKKAGVKVGKSTGRYVKTRSSKVAISASKPGGDQNAYINSLIESGKAKIDDLKDYQVGSLTKFTRNDRPGEEAKQSQGYKDLSIHIKAKELYRDAEERVDKITSDVSFCAKVSGMQMYGLDHKLKQMPSIERKIDKRMSEDGITVDEAANGLKDIVRFTTISDTPRLVNNYERFKEWMEVNGYTESRCKNYFEAYKRGEVKHKSIQCNYKTPDGYEFEIQFHTPESQDVKNRKVPLYEEVRKKNVSPERTKEIEAQMAKMAEEIPDPPNIEKIKSHS